jgi:hypothetical protein
LGGADWSFGAGWGLSLDALLSGVGGLVGGVLWRPYGNPWDVPGGPPAPWGAVPLGGTNPYPITTIVGAVPQYPAWIGPDPNAFAPPALPPRTFVTNYNPAANPSGYALPWETLAPATLAPITAAFETAVAVPSPGCSFMPVTYPSVVETTAQYTQTVTQPPPDAVVTVFVDPGTGKTSTDWGPVETVFEVIVYTTTATVPYVSTTAACANNFVNTGFGDFGGAGGWGAPATGAGDWGAPASAGAGDWGAPASAGAGDWGAPASAGAGGWGAAPTGAYAPVPTTAATATGIAGLLGGFATGIGSLFGYGSNSAAATAAPVPAPEPGFYPPLGEPQPYGAAPTAAGGFNW